MARFVLALTLLIGGCFGLGFLFHYAREYDKEMTAKRPPYHSPWEGGIVVKICRNGHEIYRMPDGQYKIFYIDLFFGIAYDTVAGPDIPC